MGAECNTVGLGPIFQKREVRRDDYGSVFPLVANHGGLSNQDVHLQRIFNRLRGYKLSAGSLDEVFFAISNIEKAIAIQLADVAGLEPAISKRRASFFLHLPIAFKDCWAFHQDLAIF